MKKLVFILIILFMIPMIANANIICNDGTTSPTCKTCHTGCCSGHNGCTDNPSNNSSKKNNYNVKKNKKNDETNIFYLIIIGIITYIISIFIIKNIIQTINKNDKIINFFRKHTIIRTIIHIISIAIALTFGWITIPLCLGLDYSILHEIISIVIITIISYIITLTE